MVLIRWFMQKQLYPVQRLVQWQRMIVILAVLSNEKVRLYAVRNRGLSLHRPRILPTWYSGKIAILRNKPGHELVYVDIPMNLLFTGETPFYNTVLGCNLYKLKGTGLRYAKRSCRKFRPLSA